MNRRVVQEILLAQIASDGGKRIRSELLARANESIFDKMDKAWHCGYPEKDIHIMNAIKMIARSKDKAIRFSVQKDDEEVAKYLVYFDIRLNGRREQVSFHSFDMSLERFLSVNRSSWIKAHRGFKATEDSRWAIDRTAISVGLLDRDGEPNFGAY